LKAPIVFRVEAGPRIGAGHLMRCLALAEAHADRGGTATFVTTGQAPALEERLREEGFAVAQVGAPVGSYLDADATRTIAEKMRAACIVVDGYDFGAGHHERLRSSGIPLAAIDDSVQYRHHCADVVVNQNLHAQAAFYRDREPHTRLLLGAPYVLLRREFVKFVKWKRRIPMQGKRLMVTLGGSDPGNVTEGLVRALANSTGLDVTIVVGGANPRRDEIESVALRAGRHIRVRADVRSMAALMARSDVAISSGGSTVWELAFMGLPAIVGASTAGEELVLDGLKRHDLFCRVGQFADNPPAELVEKATQLLDDVKRRTSMSVASRNVVDGRGVDRVLDEIEQCARRERNETREAKGATR